MIFMYIMAAEGGSPVRKPGDRRTETRKGVAKKLHKMLWRYRERGLQVVQQKRELWNAKSWEKASSGQEKARSLDGADAERAGGSFCYTRPQPPKAVAVAWM